MTGPENDELADLAEAKSNAEQALHNFGYINIANLSREEMAEVNKRRAVLHAAVVEADSRYRAFMDRLAKRTYAGASD